jgi:transcriptional regulator with XRE-family HTH domain
MTDHEQKQIFGRNLNYFIEKTGKNHADIAADLDVPRTTLSTWTAGKSIPGFKMVRQIADYFGCRINSLIEPRENESFEEKLYYLVNQMDEAQMADLLKYAEMLISFKPHISVVDNKPIIATATAAVPGIKLPPLSPETNALLGAYIPGTKKKTKIIKRKPLEA